jgi:tetratricopeptide (TPR) repeat protein
MKADRWQQVRALFDTVADAPPQDWLRALAEACPDDADLRAEALALLEAHAQVTQNETRLEAQAPDLLGVLASLAEPRGVDAWIGRRLGAWRIVRALGRGGMGVVYLAERADGQYQQYAAVKLLRDGVYGEDGLRRFRAERQMLAGLEHPHIARLLDGGVSAEGLPWFALEYVEGAPLTVWADSAGTSVRDRLYLFLDVCAAVAHAHERLIVHRDLKPANILANDRGKVKLLDFGIAKLIAPGVDEGAGTGTAMRAFTPEYAAPEQVRGEAVTTAVDVHALGLLLYELLTGQRPYHVTERTPAAYERAVLEQEPTRPSSVVARVPADVAADVPADRARRRATTPQRLSGLLRGDLDAIVLKALRKEPEQRYHTVHELAQDVRAFLAARPVTARRGTLRYTVGRFLRRHALAVTFAALALVALVGGLASALWQAHEANVQREAAQVEAGKARAIAQFLGDVFLAANPEYGDGADPRASELLERGMDALRERTDLDETSRVQLMIEMAHAYRGLGKPDRSLAISAEALALVDEDAGPLVLAEVHLSHGENLNAVGKPGDALVRLEHADGLVVRHGIDAPGLRNRLDVAHAISLINLHREGQALPLLQRYFERNQPVPLAAIDPVPPIAPYTFVLIGLGRLDEATAVSAQAYRQSLTMPELPPAAQAHFRQTYAQALTRQGEHAQAESLLREALELKERAHGVGAYHTAIVMHNLRSSVRAQGRHAEALALALRVLDICRTHQGEDSLSSGRAMIWAGVSYSEHGDHRMAVTMLEDAQQHAAGPDILQHPETAQALEQALTRSRTALGLDPAPAPPADGAAAAPAPR